MLQRFQAVRLLQTTSNESDEAKRKAGLEEEDRKEESPEWINVSKIALEDLPEMPSQERYEREKLYWERVAAQGADVKETPAIDDSYFKVDDELKIWLALERERIVPYVPLNTAEEKLHMQRYQDIFDMNVKYGNHSEIVRQFFLFRRKGFPNSVENYGHLFGIAAIWQDWKAIDMLLDEMEMLGYQLSARVLVTLMDLSIIRDDWNQLEKCWQLVRLYKYDLHSNVYAKTLFYLCRSTTSVAVIMDFYEFMKSEDKAKDPNAGNLLLHLFLENKMYDLAYKIFDEMKTSGLLDLHKDKDREDVKYEDETLAIYPKRKAMETTYLLMAQIECSRGDLKKTFEYINLAEETWKKFRKLTGRLHIKYEVPVVVREHIIYKQMDLRDAEGARQGINALIRDEIKPSEKLFRDFLMHCMTYDIADHYLEFAQEFELFGYDYDAELCEHLVQFWHRLGDDRRVVNGYMDIAAIGALPSPKAMEAYILVLERSGRHGEVQTFYDQQVKAENKLTYETHACMIRDYLKRLFPGSARDVLIRMARAGMPAKPELLGEVAVAYSKLGGGAQVAEMIEMEMDGADANYVLTPEILSAAVYGFAAKENPSADDVYLALELWDKYSPRVQLTPNSAERAIRGFGTLGHPDYAWEAFAKLNREWSFAKGSKDFSGPYTAIVEIPQGRRDYAEVLGVFDSLKEMDIIPTIEMFDGAVQQCERSGNAKGAVQVMKKFVMEFTNLPFHRGLLVNFFNTIARHDLGNYRREAMVWLNRLIPEKSRMTSLSPWMPPLRDEESLEEFKDTLISQLQSGEIGKYILSIDEEAIVVAQSLPSDDLFEGGLQDVADMLLAEGFNPAEVQRVLSEDDEAFKSFVASLHKAKEEGRPFSPSDILSSMQIGRNFRD